MNDTKKHTILYVDDEESNLRIFRNTFRRDYDVITALSGNEGLDLLEKRKVDLILTDQRMPGMSGVDFLKKAIIKYPELNRIIITAYSDYDILREAVNELQIFQYVEKPWRHEEIKNAIDSALEIYSLKKENQLLTASLLDKNNELRSINDDLNREIERHKKTQKALIKEKEVAEKSNQLKSAFLANMSHEIRTPMNSIMGFMELLKIENDSEKRENYMAIIDNSCHQLLHIIDDIIEISKIDSGNVELKIRNFSIKKMIETVFGTFNLKKSSSVEFNLSYKLPVDFPEIENDSVKIQQILNNLLNNAFKFTTNGKIEMGVDIINNNLQFYVKDTGVGISKENHEIIFQRFRQIELTASRKFGGNGLGLAISKAFVEKMEGKIWVESEPGKGATFYFTIPLNSEVNLKAFSD